MRKACLHLPHLCCLQHALLPRLGAAPARGGAEQPRACMRSRELAEAAGPGSGLAAATVLALALAWGNVEAP